MTPTDPPRPTWSTAPADYPDLDGKVAVVIGGSQGIGAAAAMRLAQCGARVVVGGRSAERLEEFLAPLEERRWSVTGIVVDGSDEESLREFAESVRSTVGPPDVLMPFAGTSSGYRGPTLEMDPATWADFMSSNLTSTFLALRTFVPEMAERGRGSVVTMGSLAGRMVDRNTPAVYGAAKAAVAHLSRHVALEVAGRGVRVNCLAPGTTDTERVRVATDAHPDFLGPVLDAVPVGRLATPAEVAEVAVFLASDRSSVMTGTTIDAALGRVTV